MQKQYDNEGSFVLFPNMNKAKETQPDATLRFTLHGEDYEVALWQRTSAAGKPYMKGNLPNLRQTNENVEPGPNPEPTFRSKPEPGDEIPF